MSSPSDYPAIQRLFARHGIGPAAAVEPLGGCLNNVFRVDGELVLRYREPALSTGSLRREAALLKRLGGRLPAPEVVAVGVDDILGEYVIQKWIAGRNLLRAWLDNPDGSTREWWMVQWTAALRAVHEERFPAPGELPEGQLRPAASWRAYIEARIRRRLDLLMRVPAADRDLILAAERYLRREAPVLEDGPCCLIHRDMHFGNALVDGPRLTALLDFELAESGPPDYELDTVYRFLRYPGQFVPFGAGGRVAPARFASVWIRLRRGYPELFGVPRLRQRLCLYALDHDLSCLLQAYAGRRAGRGGDDRSLAESALGRVREILAGRYGPD